MLQTHNEIVSTTGDKVSISQYPRSRFRRNGAGVASREQQELEYSIVIPLNGASLNTLRRCRLERGLATAMAYKAIDLLFKHGRRCSYLLTFPVALVVAFEVHFLRVSNMHCVVPTEYNVCDYKSFQV